MEEHTTQTHSLEQLVLSVEQNHALLPEFQRDFVWDINQTFDLFDSLVRNIFIGSIIYGIPSFEITTRAIDTRPRKKRGRKFFSPLPSKSYTKEEIEDIQKIHRDKFRLILDGQQRITAIYRALKGFDDVWFVMKNLKEMAPTVQTLVKDGSIGNCTLEEVLFAFAEEADATRISIKLSDVWGMMSNGPIREKEIKEKYFDHTSFAKNCTDAVEAERAFDFYLFLKDKIVFLLKDSKLFSYYLLNMSLEKFILFFERSNTRGIWLNFIDILAAKLYNGFNLRENLEELSRQYPNYQINEFLIVRTIAYLVSSENSNGNGKGAQLDRTYILTELKAEQFNRHWKEVSNLYIKVLDFLNDKKFILSQTWMPHENMIVPMMLFLRSIGGSFDKKSQNQYEFLTFWYWASIFSQRYTGASNEKMIEDAKILIAVAQNQKIEDKTYINKLLKIEISNFEEIYSYHKKGNAIYSGILNLIHYQQQGLKDWKSATTISFNDDKLEDHHIFPKNYIKKTYGENSAEFDLANCVANRTLIPKILNREIGDKAPSVYLNKLKENHNYRITESLASHAIDESILKGNYDQDFLGFLEERAKSIYESFIKTVIFGNVEAIRAHYEQK